MARKLLKHFLAGCFCICLAWFMAKIAIHFLVPPAPPQFYYPDGGKNSPAPPKKGGSSPQSVDAVLRRNLFHAVVEKPRQASVAGEEQSAAEEALLREEMGKLPISRQGWTLLGTIVNTLEPGQSRAILLVNGKQKAYAPGEALKDWKIALIDRRTIIAEKNGRRERLLVGGQEIARPAAAQAATIRKSINADEIERAMGNIPELLKQVKLSATRQNGVYGLNVTFLQPDNFMSRLGLRQNDILTSANGKTLAEMGDLATLGDLSRQNSLRLELIRNGKNIALEYDISR